MQTEGACKNPAGRSNELHSTAQGAGENYKTVYEFVYQFGITAGTVYTYKSRHQCADLFEALRGMQGERRTAYPVDGKILFGIEVRKQYGQAQLKRYRTRK